MTRAAAQGVQVSGTHSLHMCSALLCYILNQHSPPRCAGDPYTAGNKHVKQRQKKRWCASQVPLKLRRCHYSAATATHVWTRAVPAGAALTHL